MYGPRGDVSVHLAAMNLKYIRAIMSLVRGKTRLHACAQVILGRHFRSSLDFCLEDTSIKQKTNTSGKYRP